MTADGLAAATIQAKVTQDGAAVQDGTVAFKTNFEGAQFDATIADPLNPPAGVQSVEEQIVSGMAIARLYSVKKGTALVNVSFYNSVTAETVTKDVTVLFGGSSSAVASFRFVEATPQTIGLVGSGLPKSSIVTFQALDSSGHNCPEGLPVTFAASTDIASVQPTAGTTNSNGQVSTTITGGKSAGSVQVSVAAGDVRAESSTIIIAGSVASYSNFDFYCDFHAIGGLDQSGLRLKCFVDLADRESQKMSNVLVSFKSEAGAVDQSVTTMEGESAGHAIMIHRTQTPYPRNVEPAGPSDYAKLMPSWLQQPELDNGSEPFWPCNVGPDGEQGARVCNPRDGLVTIIAYTTGEEDFIDANNNKQYDSGEEFKDLPEPFVDVDDDGILGDNESYVDVNGNNQWDDANGKWDANTTIWQEVKVLWTGGPYSPKTSVSYLFGGLFRDGAPLTSLSLPACGGSTGGIEVGFWDINFNKPAMVSGESISCWSSQGAFSVEPASVLENNNTFGRSLVGGFKIRAPVVAAPCPTVSDSLNCSGQYTMASDSEPDVSIDVWSTGVVSVPVTLE